MAEITQAQRERGTHVVVQRGDYLLLCALAGLTDKDKIMEIDDRSERVIISPEDERVWVVADETPKRRKIETSISPEIQPGDEDSGGLPVDRPGAPVKLDGGDKK